MDTIPVTYGYARVSKADDDSKNLETQLRELDAHGIRRDLVFTDEASGFTLDRPGWRDLMSRVQPGDTVVVAFLDRFSRNFEEGVAIQADLTRRNIAPLTWTPPSARPTDWPRRAHATTAIPASGAITRCWPSPPATC